MTRIPVSARVRSRTSRAVLAVGANLRGLPPVIIVNADIDPLRDDGATLETALRNAGVQVQRRNYEGAVHEFFSMADVVRDAYDAQQWSFGLVRQSLMR